jgi:WD40 repeat protein
MRQERQTFGGTLAVCFFATLVACGSARHSTSPPHRSSALPAPRPSAPASVAASPDGPPAPPDDMANLRPVVSWSRDGTKVAARGVIVDVARKEELDTGCDGPAPPQWADGDVVACERSDGRVEIHDLATKKTVTLEACGHDPRWDASGRYLLPTQLGGGARQQPCAKIFDRVSASFVELPPGFDEAEWIGGGTVLRLHGSHERDALLWDARSRAAVGSRYAVAFSLDSTAPSGAFVLELLLARPSERAVSEAFLIDAKSGSRRRIAQGISDFAAPPDELRLFSPGGAEVAVPIAEHGVKLFDVQTASPAGSLMARPCETPTQIAWSPKGDLIAVGSDSSSICLFDARTHALVRSWAISGVGSGAEGSRSIYLLAFVAGGRGLVAGNFEPMSNDGQIATIWDVATGKEVQPPLSFSARATHGIRSTTRGDALLDTVHIDPDLGVHEASSDGPMWNLVEDISAEGRFIGFGLQTDGVPLPPFERAEDASFVKLNADGSKVFGRVDGAPRVWDMETGKLVFP